MTAAPSDPTPRNTTMTSKRPNAKDARFGVCRLCPVTVEHWHEGEARPIPSATTEEPTDA